MARSTDSLKDKGISVYISFHRVATEVATSMWILWPLTSDSSSSWMARSRDSLKDKGISIQISFHRVATAHSTTSLPTFEKLEIGTYCGDSLVGSWGSTSMGCSAPWSCTILRRKKIHGKQDIQLKSTFCRFWRGEKKQYFYSIRTVGMYAPIMSYPSNSFLYFGVIIQVYNSLQTQDVLIQKINQSLQIDIKVHVSAFKDAQTRALFHKGLRLIIWLISIVAQWQIMY